MKLNNQDLINAPAAIQKRGVVLRQATPEDHKTIISVMVDWWGGRDLRFMMLKLYLNHFFRTSFIVEKGDELIAFIIGFMSPSLEKEAYIHFSGIHPDYRMQGLGRELYAAFLSLCKSNGRNIVKCCTSPVNVSSINFHTRIGFEIEPGNGEENGFAITRDYNREGDSKVIFKIDLENL